MKLILVVAAITIFPIGLVSGQSLKQNEALEVEIRKLDLAEAEAIKRRDFAALNKLLAEDFTVNSPRNEIIKGREGVYALIRSGVVNYSSFEREPEVVLIYKHTVVVMGRESIKPTGNAPGAGQTVRRRYTNIWVERKGKWLLTARHASVICEVESVK